MTKKCVIDIGSNTIKLFIAELTKNNIITPLIVKRRMARLGKGIIQTKKLPEEAKEITIKYIQEYMETCSEHEIPMNNIMVTATAACRIASDGNKFIDQLKQKFKFKHIKILSGEEESKYTFLGALKSTKTNKGEYYCVLDIGGGSFQLSIGTSEEYIRGISIPMGCNSVTEDFKLNQISTQENTNKAINFFKNYEIKGFNIPKKPLKVLGAGGSIKIMELMLRDENNLNPLTLKELENTANFLSSINVNARFEWFKNKYKDETFRLDAGLTKNRAEVILAGICIAIGIMKKLSANEIILSTTDAKNYVITLSDLS